MPQKSDNAQVSDNLAKPKPVLQQSEALQKKKRLHNEISLREKCPIASTLTPSSTIRATQSMELNDATNNKVDSRISDTTLYRSMEEKKLECFNDLADVDLIIDDYEARTGNQLQIQKSQKDTFCVYCCCEHVTCTFQVRFSRRQSDGLFVLSKLSTKHSGVRPSSRCADGRRRKQRRKGK
jgi:hypothetical protein